MATFTKIFILNEIVSLLNVEQSLGGHFEHVAGPFVFVICLCRCSKLCPLRLESILGKYVTPVRVNGPIRLELAKSRSKPAPSFPFPVRTSYVNSIDQLDQLSAFPRHLNCHLI